MKTIKWIYLTIGGTEDGNIATSSGEYSLSLAATTRYEKSSGLFLVYNAEKHSQKKFYTKRIEAELQNSRFTAT